MRGLVEFIAIIGLIAVAAVVATVYYLSTTQIYIPPEIAQEIEPVRQFVTNLAREQADRTIRVVEKQGGFLADSLPPDVPVYGGRPVAVWAACDQASTPSLDTIKAEIIKGLNQSIQGRLQPEMEIAGKPVTFYLNQLAIQSAILDDKITFSITLPMKIANISDNRPITFEIPTRFGYIYKFGSDFVAEQTTHRPIEWATIRNLYASTLPTFGIMTKCGEIIFLTPMEVAEGLEDVVSYTLLNTYFWQLPGTSGMPLMLIEKINNNQYVDLSPKLQMPDRFSFQPLDSVIFANVEMPSAEKAGFKIYIPICEAFYDQNYSFDFPFIVTVWDQLLENQFSFAIRALVNQSQPGECIAIQAFTECKKEFDMQIKVQDAFQNPIPNAVVKYAGCTFQTDENGIISDKIPKIDSKLTVSHPDYAPYYEDERWNVMSNKIITLHKIPKIRFNFVELKDTTVLGIHQLESGVTCQTAKPIDTEFIILNITSTERPSLRFVISNVDLEADMNTCLEQAGVKEQCDVCVKLSPEEVYGNPACDACMRPSAQCMKVKNFTDIDFLPGGNYRIDAQIFDLTKMLALSQDTPWYQIPWYITPVKTRSTNVQIPEDDSEINVFVWDMDYIISKTESEFSKEYDDCCGTLDLKCEFGDIFLPGEPITTGCKGEGLQKAMEYLTKEDYFPLEVCLV